ncbi:MAG: family 78 glycoside hydrolase catalytic domain [Bacteroidales bacterium]|nr:family 78 glycoside hydrolase catalytic domain [Candidatus Cryptobacteroides choladohippi]
MKAKYILAAILAAAAASACCSTPCNCGYTSLAEPLDNSAWESSEWISAADAPVVTDKDSTHERAADGASWFVAEVTNAKKVKSAKWMTTGLGIYDIFVNGQNVGKEILKPGFTHPYKTKRSFTYDVTALLDPAAGARNVLAAEVTPGWWGDRIVTPGEFDGMLGNKCAFRAVLEITYKDGSRELFGTDTENWKAGIAGPVKHAAIFDGEEYDARELPGWCTPDKLSTPEINTEFSGAILPSNGAEVYMRHDLALKPVKAYTWSSVEGNDSKHFGKVVISKEFACGETMTVEPGETLVIDFGQNCASVPAFKFNAAAGTRLTCLPGELLNDGNGAHERGMDGPEGSVHRENLRIPDYGMILDYTFADSEDDVEFTPRKTFFGYRFVSITATGKVTISSIESIPVTSIAKELETGTISTGNELINRLISNTIWGQRSNYLSVSTDCPQRNERLGWTADTQVFTETGTFFANTDPFFHKWLQDMRDTQSKLGGYPGVAPLAQYGGDDGNMMRVGWADAGIIVPWTIWKQYGDNSIIEESWESMERYMEHVARTKYDHTALSAENSNYQWADWLSYEALESCSGRMNDNFAETLGYWNYLCASYWAIDAAMMRDMASAAGKDAAKYEQMTAEAKAYIKDTFMNEDGTFKTAILNTMQTPALFALKNGILEGKAKEDMCARLRKNFEDHDNCLQTGFLGTSILMGTLTDNGMEDIAYELLFQRRNPSWLYSVDNGATTIWERWNSYTLEDGMGPKGMNSFNHYAYGCVCQWIWETAAGIAADPAKPGFRHIIMKPVPDKRLGHLDAEFKSAAGTIKSSWKYEGDAWVWTFTIPEGASASVTLPGETEAAEYGAGTWTISR